MKTVALGSQGLTVSVQGFGAMSMSGVYGASRDKAEAVATLNHAVDLGITLFDTAESYGPFDNERLLGEALGARRDDILLATKFGLDFSDDGQPGPLDGRPEHIRRAVERSLRHFGTDVIDLYYMHRVDPNIPIEESVGGMAELVSAGKVRYIGLSEVSSATIRRAHAVYPLTAVQSEMSLFSRDLLDSGIKETLDELGIGVVGYSPIGRGFLSGAIRSLDDLEPDDSRRGLPRFSAENIAANLKLVDYVRAIAENRGATPAQVALAWVSTQGAVPIPGTKRRSFLSENAAAADMTLTSDELATLDAALRTEDVSGTRYTAQQLASTNR
ncbi:aldo/keto reductase [Streptomyces sp. ADI93-02]|uniref:aldo/keto reductase n=1 Tax=Streptomyces sp. ADI93-02 TaxID=1522757 RepID=UPI000F5544C3|nr:aldo/keto reductase [Streptomyces sp. ADI93-02]RPK33301.1 L-glyceraldehyde 3-phosphate reductase [Streptomyces sp. ADI93-02]